MADSINDKKSKEEEILRNARKQVLFWKGDTWTKIGGNLFDVSMGSPDGAELCELAGLFCLDLLRKKLPAEELGLYRDDGLGVTSKSGPGSSKIEKTLHSTFKGIGLKITTIVNVKKVEFLDAILDLSNNRRAPFRKPLDTPIYVNSNSSHPPSVIKQIPKAVQDRLSTLSSTKQDFDLAAPPYVDALKKAGYKGDIEFKKPEHKLRKNRPRKCIWFNPPYSAAVATNLTKLYADVIKKSFPKDHPYLSKLFNKNNMRLSYSCTQNMGSIISSHNRSILAKEDQDVEDRSCNCRKSDPCPLDGKCLTKEIVYEATVEASNGDVNLYIGATETPFKTRLYNHNKSFNHEKYKNETTLSSHIWELKRKGLTYNIKWKLIKKSKSYSPSIESCRLCIDEKVEIWKNYNNPSYVNKRTELFCKCIHRRKHLLAAVH